MVRELGAFNGNIWCNSVSVLGLREREARLAFGVNGTATLASQMGFLFGDAVILSVMIMMDKDNDDFMEHFLIRNNMVSEYFALTLSCVLMLTSGIVMAVCIGNYRKREKAERGNDDK